MDKDNPLVELIRVVASSSLTLDKSLLQLCEALIAEVNVHTEVIRNQQERITRLEQRHEALLTAFYSHCQDVAEEIH